ncbi:MAG: aminopeptidase P family protein [Bacilli bacterium]|nr:aminopeptidase P family protein [Bacilli bacterium]
MKRLDKLRGFLLGNNADGIIVSSYPNIFYFSEFTSENALLYITREKAYLITDSRYTIQAKKEAKGYDVIVFKNGFLKELEKLIIKGSNILFEESMTYARYNAYSSNLECNLVATNIDSLRNIKDEKEIKNIKKACDIASKTYDHIINFVKPGMKEKEVANEMIHYMKSLGASKESFETIVASGKRGAMPHGTASNKVIRDGDFVTLDYGCIYNGYCSDITRSFLVGNDNKEMIKIYNIVKKAQELAVKSVKAGVRASEVDKVARDYITSKGYGKYFTHSTGHGLGIEVHDPISVSSRSDMVLEENMIITIEPGIYIKNLGGIRIEDDVLVTKDGYKILTKASKKLIKITE